MTISNKTFLHKSKRCESLIKRKQSKLHPVYVKVTDIDSKKRSWISVGRLCQLCLVFEPNSGLNFADFEK